MRGREDTTHHQTLLQRSFVALLTHAAPLMTDGSQINRASVSSSVTTAANANRGATRAKTTRRHSMTVSNTDALAAIRDDWERKRQIGGVRCENTVGTARSVARNAFGAARSVVRTLSVPRQACYMLCGHLSKRIDQQGTPRSRRLRSTMPAISLYQEWNAIKPQQRFPRDEEHRVYP